MFKWITSVLGHLGLWNKKARILFLGLDNAGKTTLTRMLVDKKLSSMAPTRHPQGDEIQYKNIRFKTFDMGGHAVARGLWADYFTNVDAVIYVVDSFDKARFPETRSELQKLLADPALAKAPFLIFGNKIDIDGAASEDELREALGLTKMTTGKQGRPSSDDIRPIEVFMCSVLRRSGFLPGIEWLSEQL